MTSCLGEAAGIPAVLRESGSEMKDKSSAKLEVILGLAEKTGSDIVSFKASGKTGIEVVICAAA